jgi:ribosomal protein L32
MNTNKSSTLPSCSKCGAKVQPNDRFCGHCGVALELSPKDQPQKTSLENDLKSPTTKSPAEEYEFQKKGSWIFGTEMYVPRPSPRGEHESGAEIRKGRRNLWGLSSEIIKKEGEAFLVCPACGQKLQKGGRVCANCGVKVGDATLSNPEKTKLTQMAEHPEGPYGEFTDVQVVEKGFNEIAATDTELMRHLKIPIETLNQHLSVLLTAIHTIETRIFWYSVAILFFTVVLVALTGYDIFFRHQP